MAAEKLSASSYTAVRPRMARRTVTTSMEAHVVVTADTTPQKTNTTPACPC